MNLSLITGVDRPQDGVLPTARVLIVDDVPQNLIAMRALLERDGTEILTAQSGAEALELLLVNDVSVALLDVQMPGMDGFELAELMRGSQRTRDVPIIFVTATPHDPVRTFQGYDAGAVDFLHKPVDPRIIASKVGVFTELSRQRLLLQSRNEMLQRSLTLNETMMAVIGHDLRTPLSVVHICASTLANSCTDARAKDPIAKILSSTNRMARMLDQLMEFSRIRSGGLRLLAAEGDLAELAGEAADEIRNANPGLDLQVEAHGDLVGCFDRDRLAQVFANLLSNAARHSSDGTVRLRLDGSRTHELHFEVSNAGRIDEALLPRLFEPFKGAFHASQGLGLGLYIVDQFLRAHGGEPSVRASADEVVFSGFIRRAAPC